MSLCEQLDLFAQMYLTYFDLRQCSRQEALHTELDFVTGFLVQRAKLYQPADTVSPEAGTFEYKDQSYATGANSVRNDRTIPFNMLMEDKGMLQQLQGEINRAGKSGVM